MRKKLSFTQFTHTAILGGAPCQLLAACLQSNCPHHQLEFDLLLTPTDFYFPPQHNFDHSLLLLMILDIRYTLKNQKSAIWGKFSSYKMNFLLKYFAMVQTVATEVNVDFSLLGNSATFHI